MLFYNFTPAAGEWRFWSACTRGNRKNVDGSTTGSERPWNTQCSRWGTGGLERHHASHHKWHIFQPVSPQLVHKRCWFNVTLRIPTKNAIILPSKKIPIVNSHNGQHLATGTGRDTECPLLCLPELALKVVWPVETKAVDVLQVLLYTQTTNTHTQSLTTFETFILVASTKYIIYSYVLVFQCIKKCLNDLLRLVQM